MDVDVTGYLQLYTLLIAIIRPAIVIALLSGLWLALRRLTLTPGQRMVTWLAVAVPLVLWLGVVWNLAEAGAFQARSGTISPLPITVAVPVLIGLIGLMSSRRIAAAVDAAPVAWLIALQVYRLIGGNFILLWLYGAVPGVFALPAGIGDVLVGLTAIPVALYLASGRAAGVPLAIAWNIFGILDLADALTLGRSIAGAGARSSQRPHHELSDGDDARLRRATVINSARPIAVAVAPEGSKPIGWPTAPARHCRSTLIKSCTGIYFGFHAMKAEIEFANGNKNQNSQRRRHAAAAARTGAAIRAHA